jgi:Fe-S cluster biogenesis protein NfuA
MAEPLLRQFLQHSDLSVNLVGGLVDMEILNETRDVDFIQGLLTGSEINGSDDRAGEIDPLLNGQASPQTYTELINDPMVSTEEKVMRVIQDYVAPVLENDGGNIDLLGFDPNSGEVTVRFVGSCANCPSSILSVETLVKPPLLNIPGVHRVVHRTRLRLSDKSRVEKTPIKLIV